METHWSGEIIKMTNIKPGGVRQLTEIKHTSKLRHKEFIVRNKSTKRCITQNYPSLV